VIRLSSAWFDDALEECGMEASKGVLGRECGLRDNVSEVGVDVIMGDGGMGDESTTLASTSRTSNCGAACTTCRSVCIGIGVKRRGYVIQRVDRLRRLEGEMVGK
jgi:hypothetical protein